MGERSVDSGRRDSLSSTSPLTATNDNRGQGRRIPSDCCGSSPRIKVKYKMVVSGETFGAHLQILEEIQTLGLNLIKGKEEESCITFLFCPVTSRIGTDAEAAMRTVPGSGPVILVLMHYSQEANHVSSSEVISSDSNVVLEVNIFYHRNLNGLLRCEQNENALSKVKDELIKHRRQSNCVIL